MVQLILAVVVVIPVVVVVLSVVVQTVVVLVIAVLYNRSICYYNSSVAALVHDKLMKLALI